MKLRKLSSVSALWTTNTSNLDIEKRGRFSCGLLGSSLFDPFEPWLPPSIHTSFGSLFRTGYSPRELHLPRVLHAPSVAARPIWWVFMKTFGRKEHGNSEESCTRWLSYCRLIRWPVRGCESTIGYGYESKLSGYSASFFNHDLFPKITRCVFAVRSSDRHFYEVFRCSGFGRTESSFCLICPLASFPEDRCFLDLEDVHFKTEKVCDGSSQSTKMVKEYHAKTRH